ncbi:MAG: PorP/SprF family type IX secretion system membrane protein [Bacteroidota bacterium]
MPVILLLVWLLATPALAQIHPLSDQYLLNLYQLNPAVAGTERYAPLTFNTRQQWVGWNDAPTTQSVTFHTRLRAKGMFYTNRGFRNKGKNSFGKVGLGGGFFNYSYGSVSQTGIHLDYAYHLSLDRGRLAFGLAPSFFQYRMNKFRGLVFPDPNTIDPVMNDSTESILFLDFNAGMHYYSEKGYAGLSVVQLLGSSVKFGDFGFPEEEDPSLNSDLAQTVYAYGGYYFQINRDVKIEPMLLAKYNTRNGFRFDINATLHLKGIFDAGAGYRWKEGFTASTGVRLDNLSVHYLFEIPVTSKVPSRFTTHMIQVLFNLGQPIE